MRTKSPLTEWREKYGMSVAELAALCHVTDAEIARVEAGKEGLIGEIQDCLTQRGENVSAMASEHSEFLAAFSGTKRPRRKARLPVAGNERTIRKRSGRGLGR